MARVLVVATSRKTRGGITSVVKAHEQGRQWKYFHCHWVQTHRDGPGWRKMAYFVYAVVHFCILLPICDIVHIHGTAGTSIRRKHFFAKLAKRFGKRIIFHFHPSGEDLLQTPIDARLCDVFSLADVIIVLSPQWERLVNDAFPNNKFHIKVLWNPCPTISDVCYNPDNHNILFAGTVIPRKGYDVLLRAFARIAGEFPDWTLEFAGNGEIEHGKQIAVQYGIQSQVQWLGWISGERKDRTFREAGIYCLSSWGEGLPMGVLDACAYGIPIVSTPVGGIPDVAGNGDNMLLFDSGDDIALASQLTRLMSDREQRLRLSAASLRLAATVFNRDKVNQSLSQIYNALTVHKR